MMRRSKRLQEAGYYTEEGNPSLSYKETLHRIFSRRTGSHRHSSRSSTSQSLGYRVHDTDSQHCHSTGSTRSSTGAQAGSAPPFLAEARNLWTPPSETSRTQAWSPNQTQDLVWRSVGSQTNYTCSTRVQTQWLRPRSKQEKTKSSFSTKMVCGLLLPLLLLLALAFGFSHMQLQEKELQIRHLQDQVRSLQQQVDTFPLADTMVNFASSSGGARVVQGSETYRTAAPGSMWERFLGWFRCNTWPRVIEGHSRLQAGRCWCFQGDRGHLVISLSDPVSISHVTLGHIAKSQSPNGRITSAPREFSVYAMNHIEEEGTYLGTLLYDEDGPVHQTWELPKPDQGVFRFVKLQIENNWGNEDYTCLYSFRVHGNLPT